MSGSESLSPAEAVHKYWWILLLNGLLGAIIGCYLIVSPFDTLATLTLVVGIYLIIWSVLQVVASVLRQEDRGLGVMLGVLGLLAGLIVVRNPVNSILFVTLAFGVYQIIWGVVAGVSLFSSETLNKGVVALEAVLAIIIGIVVISYPQPSISVLALIFGIFALAYGVLEIIAAFALRKLANDALSASSS